MLYDFGMRGAPDRQGSGEGVPAGWGQAKPAGAAVGGIDCNRNEPRR